MLALVLGIAAFVFSSPALALLAAVFCVFLLLAVFIAGAMLLPSLLGFSVAAIIMTLSVIAFAPNFASEPVSPENTVIGGADGPTEIYVHDEPVPAAAEDADAAAENAVPAAPEEIEPVPPACTEADVPSPPVLQLTGISLEGGEDDGIRIAVPSEPEVFWLITSIEP